METHQEHFTVRNNRFPLGTLLSHLQKLNEHAHRDDPEWLKAFYKEKQQATRHIDFSMVLYRHRLRNGLHFIHGHPEVRVLGNSIACVDCSPTVE